MPLKSSVIEEIFLNRGQIAKKFQSLIINLNIEYEDNEKAIVTAINKLLQNAKQRREGLEYLTLIVKNCSLEIVKENALNWTNHCMVKSSDDTLRELRLNVLGSIIEVSHNESEFNKKFTAEYISKVFDTCMTTSFVNVSECKAALKTLTTCMIYYPSWFGGHREKIEKYILYFLDNENENLVCQAAIAFHYLQQTGSAGTYNINHKASFTNNFQKLCRTMHTLYNDLLKNEKELFPFKKSVGEIFQFNEDTTDSFHPMYKIRTRIINVLKFLEIMIRKKFPAAKEANPRIFLDVIVRGVSFHKCMTGKELESLQKHQFSLILNEIQTVLFKLLKLFLVWYNINILPFSYTISKAIMDTLELSHNCGCFKSDGFYLESIYKATREWITLSKSSLHTQFQCQLIECIIQDITPVKSQVTLTISDADVGKKSLKAKRKYLAEKIISGSRSDDRTTLVEKNSEIHSCNFALETLKVLLENAELDIKPELLDSLYNSIFGSLREIQSSKPIHPYTDRHCQRQLYEVLVAFYYQETLDLLPPLQTGLDILVRGVNHTDRFISDVCERGVKILELLCQPICPSLYLAIEKEIELIDDQREESEVGQKDESVEEDITILELPSGEVSDVDFDASTDELPTHRKKSATEDAYTVKQPETDGSIVDDRSSEKSDIQFEELLPRERQDRVDIDDTFIDDPIVDVHYPIVTAPSEDGNEVLEKGDEMIKIDNEACSSSTDFEQEQTTASKNIDILQEINNILLEEDITKEGSKESTVNQESVENNAEKALQDITETKECAEKASSIRVSEVHPDEPQPKKARLDEEEVHPDEPQPKKVGLDEEEDMGDVFSEHYDVKQEVDSSFNHEDSSFADEVIDEVVDLEDDSFVDVTKE